MHLSLRTRILLAVLGAVLATDLLAVWVVNDRIVGGAVREADQQARAQTAQVQALYAEHAATLAAESEAVSLYPAVIAALVDGNPKPLLTWSGQLTRLQGTRVTVTDAAGRVVARGHAPDLVGDDLAADLAGLRQALAEQKVSGTEAGDEIGLAVRGYAPVRQGGLGGPVVGAVMIADPLDEPLIARIMPGQSDQASAPTPTPGSAWGPTSPRVEPLAGGAATTDGGIECAPLPAGAPAATCRFAVFSPLGQPTAAVVVTVPLAQIDQARADAQRNLWLIGGLVLLVGAAAAWLLARSLTRPLGRLTVAAQQIAEGAYDQPTGLGGGDEIGTLARSFDTMRERVAAADAQVRGERDVLDAVLEASQDGILLVDEQGRTLVENRHWAELLGGHGLAAAADLHAPDLDERHATFAEAAAAWRADLQRVVGTEFERHTPAYRRFRCYTAPASLRAGAPIGRLFVLRDVTRETEAERMRSALVATVSHELRAPLTVITGYTDTLLNAGPWDAETERDFLEIIAQSAAKLAGLVDNLLDAAKAEAGVLRVEREPVRLERLVERTVEQRRGLTPNHRLLLEVAADLPLVDADPVRIEQVLANLLDNAIKYSPNGGPIRVYLGRDRGNVVISVSDSGIGLTPDQAEHVFDRFYRADGALTRTTRGVGLGLFICKSLVEAHGGRIWVQSRPDGGSTFSYTLPALVEGAAEAAPRQEAVA
jgi:PAS domain S-box-containing protein